jgi:hypothetical protein
MEADENKVLRRIFVSKRKGVIGHWRKLLIELAGHVTC